MGEERRGSDWKAQKDLQAINVTVTPNETPTGKDVPCKIDGDAHQEVIFLEYDQAYDITFTLSPGLGVTVWGNQPFANMQGHCPPESCGPNSPFSLGSADPSKNSITVHVDPVHKQPHQRIEMYRLNFNDDFFSDPIIIIGSS